MPSPDKYNECLSWKNRCLRLYEQRETVLCELLGVSRAGIEMALLEARTYGMSHQIRHAVANWIETENELAHALTLVELAEAIDNNRRYQELDE